MELNVRDLSVSLGGASIVNKISLQVQEKKFVGLLGPNGCGKSTLLKSIYKVIKPDEGQVHLSGTDLLKSSPKAVSQLMGVVGQFNDLSFDFTVREMVMMGRTPHKKLLDADNAADFRIVDEAIRKVGLEAYSSRSYLSLSGGEKQRVILARALAQQPQFLVLDEPTNHLDVKYQLQILNIVRSLNIGVLAALHDLSLAAKYCDYLYLIKKGKVAARGEPKEVLTRERIADVFEVECEIYDIPVTGGLGIAYLASK
ncbi:ABC transporter ATP-binding protein [Cohnella thailandensis]|uniref:ABC transporter ATP-binding protein n=1 Tax=Cohnella thailandensis TaxID=557557 RepID=A0A841SSJ0_9BACL|nr:ABC transporter ATP-binding protein [Cohnella thailandensis]MBB6633025.1 ABC transporter ATP-binding protein [Cohnella thailandensis]MBP1975280.1 iron complex transport system ATP-binding protein [Cohnella thailandensis]